MKAIIQANRFDKQEAILIELLGKEKFEQVKKDNPGALIEALGVCHEGEIWPGRSARKGVPIRITRDNVIGSIHDMPEDLKIYHRHNSDNRTDNRPSIGKVIGKGLVKAKKGLTGAVVALYESSKASMAAGLKSVSAEFEIDSIDESSRSYVNSIKYTGFAKDNEKPAFPHSGTLATVQCFEYENKEGIKLEPITIEQVREFLRNGTWFANQLFPEEKIIGKPIVENGKVRYEGGDKIVAELIRRIEAAHAESYKKLQDEKNALQSELDGLKGKERAAELMPKLGEAAEERKVIPQVKKLAEEALKNKKVEPGKEDEAIREAIDFAINKNEELTALGYKAGDIPDSDNGKSGGLPPGTSTGKGDVPVWAPEDKKEVTV